MKDQTLIEATELDLRLCIVDLTVGQTKYRSGVEKKQREERVFLSDCVLGNSTHTDTYTHTHTHRHTHTQTHTHTHVGQVWTQRVVAVLLCCCN